MIYRRKNTKKRNAEAKPNNVKHYDQQPPRNKTKNPKRQRLIQVEAEIQELVHIFSYENQEKMDKLMLERWQLRYYLNL